MSECMKSLLKSVFRSHPNKPRLQNEDKRLRFEQKTHKMFNASSVMQIRITLPKILSPAHNLVAHEITEGLITHHMFHSHTKLSI